MNVTYESIHVLGSSMGAQAAGYIDMYIAICFIIMITLGMQDTLLMEKLVEWLGWIQVVLSFILSLMKTGWIEVMPNLLISFTLQVRKPKEP